MSTWIRRRNGALEDCGGGALDTSREMLMPQCLSY
jgi:hypothetical protein